MEYKLVVHVREKSNIYQDYVNPSRMGIAKHNSVSTCRLSVPPVKFNHCMTDAVIINQWTGFYMKTASVTKGLNFTKFK